MSFKITRFEMSIYLFLKHGTHVHFITGVYQIAGPDVFSISIGGLQPACRNCLMSTAGITGSYLLCSK